MSEGVLTAILAFAGTILGSVCGIIASARLTNYKIQVLRDDFTDLRERVGKHNNLVERLTIVEQSTKSAHKRIDEAKTTR